MTNLRVIDGNGELDDESAVVPLDYALLLEQNRKLLREKAALQGRLTRLLRDDPDAELVTSLLVYWRNRCRGPLSRVEIPVDGRRGDAVRRTLKRLVDADEDPQLANPDKTAHKAAVESATERAAAKIREAIDGCAAFPYAGAYGKRFAEPGPRLERKDEIVYVLRDEIVFERFRGLHDGDARRKAYAADLYRRLTTQPNLRLVLASFDPEMGEVLARAIRWVQANP